MSKLLNTPLIISSRSLLWKLIIFPLLTIPSLAFSNAHTSICHQNTPPISATTELAERLGWTPSTEPDNLCGGYYVEPNLMAFGLPISPIEQSTTSISFDNPAVFSQRGTSTISGNVVVVQSGRQLEADKAVVYRDPKTGKIITLDLLGNIHVIEPGRLILGSKAHLNFDQQSGVIDAVTYRILLVRDQQIAEVEEALANNKVRLHGAVAWGQASQAIQHAPGVIELTNASYTTCAPTTEQWRLLAAKLTINKQLGRGVAHDVKFTVHGKPVFYTPYISFPTDTQRKTGFLMPSINTSNTSGTASIKGVYLSIPFYWNIAPNYDLTLTPRIYSNRGVLFDGVFRYLTHNSFGNLSVGFLPGDREFRNFQSTAALNFPDQFGLDSLLHDSDNRLLINWQNTTIFNPHWSSMVDYTYVSDDYYFQDFGGVPSVISASQLLRQADLRYTGEHWDFSALAESYETLHPVNRQPINNLYSRLPQLDLTAVYPNLWDKLDFSIQNQAVYFTSPISPFQTTSPPRGSRLNIQPLISLPHYAPAGFFIPSLQLQETYYSVQNQLPDNPNNINRFVPTLDLDTGLYFDRNVMIHNIAYQQTIEPRLYYLYVPFVGQNSIPVYDSAVIPFTYDQLFASNRFSGYDRVGDTNQVTLAVLTRIIDNETGEEKFHAGIGEIYYFTKRKVTICNSQLEPGCIDFDTGLGATPNNEGLSPIAAQLSYTISPGLSANGDLTWDLHSGQPIAADFYIQINPTPNILFNFGYNFLRNGDIIQTSPSESSNNLSTANASFAVPLSTAWSTVGVVNYDFQQNEPTSFLFGLQYDSCCWAFRVLGGRTYTALNQNGTPKFGSAFHLQLVLKGLANIDPSDTASQLTSQIPGYRDPFAETSTMHQMFR